MGFHMEEEHIIDGTIDNRTKGVTVLKINFANHTSSLVTLQGNPCRDLAGSLWKFKNPHARMAEEPSGPCFFIPPLSEGTVGRISYTTRRRVPVLPTEEHYDLLFDEEKDDPPTRMAPVLELEWFSHKYKQVEIACQQMVLELVEMSWTITPEEAAAEKAAVDHSREETIRGEQESMAGFLEEMELIEEFVAHDPEPHELEEFCHLIVQDFIINQADDSERNQELRGDLLKLQEQMAGAFVHLGHHGEFHHIPKTIRLLTVLLPFIDRAAVSANFLAQNITEHLLRLRQGVVELRDELDSSSRI